MQAVFPKLTHLAVVSTGLDGIQYIGENMFSPFAQLLPHLEAHEVFDQLNLSRDAFVQSARDVELAAFRCASDGRHASGGNCNYAVNCGSTAFSHNSRGRYATTANGAFEWIQSLAPRDFIDGMAQTAGLAERVVGDDDPKSFDRRSDILRFRACSEAEANVGGDDFAVACARVEPLADDFWHISTSGKLWILFGIGMTSYNHFRGPNADVAVCNTADILGSGADIKGIVSARSNDGAAVQWLTMDSALRAADKSVDLEV